MAPVTIVHDYLTQRGGAERVVLSMLKAFPDAALHVSLYEPTETFPEFQAADVRTLAMNRVTLLRRNHRLALPLLGPSFARYTIDAPVVVCSSSGWAHCVRATGSKVVYCYSPARWLYQAQLYEPGLSRGAKAALAALRPSLLRRDRAAALEASRYLTNSTAVRERIRAAYGLDAEVLPSPPTLDPDGDSREVDGVDPGFFLTVSRLLAYKNVEAVVDAFAALPNERLVVVGSGPEERRLAAKAGGNVRLLRAVSDAQLRWLYANAHAVVAAAYEDFGLTPLEGATFGKPAAALRFGGFLDTIEEGTTGMFFEQPTARAVAEAVTLLRQIDWDRVAIRAHADRFSEERFIRRLREVVDEVALEAA